MNLKNRRRCALVVAFTASALAVAGASATVLLHRHPDLWAPRPQTTYFRVQSRSMEPAMLGPRFAWLCPICNSVFYTSVDVGPGPAPSELALADAVSGATISDSGANEESYDAKKALANARFFSCPNCGYDRVSTESPAFEDGALFSTRNGLDDVPEESVLDKLKRAIKRELDPDFREKDLKKAEIQLERWNVVVFRDKFGRPTLKRVVGLPNELVALGNGDVFINGKTPFRTWREIAKTAVPVKPVEFRRSDDRIDAVHYTPIWENGDSVKRPTAISNESVVQCCNGSNVASVELVRDFALVFNWGRESGLPVRFAVLVRRPEKALLLKFDESVNQVTIRAKTLYNGRAGSGKKFEELAEADFANEQGSMYALREPIPEDPLFTVAAIDGELLLAVDGEELLRYDLGDRESTAAAAIAQPFSLLGNVVHARNLALYRDLHYSNVAETRTGASPDVVYETIAGRAVKTPQDGYFMLGDNSPASIDSRFEALGVVNADDVMFVVE